MHFITKKKENQTTTSKKERIIIGICIIVGMVLLVLSFVGVLYATKEKAMKNEMLAAKSQNSVLISEQLTEATKYLMVMSQEIEKNKNQIKAIETIRKKSEQVSDPHDNADGEEIKKQKKELDDRLEALDQHLSMIHLKVGETKEQVDELKKKTGNVSGVSDMTDTTEPVLLESFWEVQNSILQIAKDQEAMKTEVTELIVQITKIQSDDQKDLMLALMEMEKNLNNDSEKSSSDTKVLLERMEEQQSRSARQTEAAIGSNVFDTGERITGEIKLAYDELKNQQLLLGNQISEQGEGMKTFLEVKDEKMQTYLTNELASIHQKLDTVFGSVSNGKQLLASALLTKGVSISKDATFKEYEEAIKQVSQEINIGSSQLPGEISYEYHRHTDGQGNFPAAEEVGTDQTGGCYTMPIYHIHTGNSKDGGGCYSRPVYHTHADTCYRTTRTQKTITGFQFTGQGTGNACCDDAHGQNWAFCNYRIDTYVNEVLVSSTNGREDLGYCCGRCVERTAMERGYQNAQIEIICGEKEGLLAYETECGMANDTIVSYRPSCGLVDQQIIGAHIWYQKDNTVSENNTSPSAEAVE